MAEQTHGHEEWKPAFTPFDADLHDVVHTSDGPYAVGSSGTLVANRGEGWEVLVDAGPAARNSTLRAMAATDDGTRVWFVGASGAIGTYDVVAQTKYDYSYSGDVTNSWRAVSVFGKAGKEKGLVGNGAGQVLPFTLDGQDVSWEQPTKPGSGAAITGLATTTEGTSYAIDDAGRAYRARKGERKWTDLGSLDAQVGFNAVYADVEGHVYVAAGNGRLYRYDDSASQWTPIGVGNAALVDVSVESESVYVLDANGVVHHRPIGSGHEWRRASPPVGSDLLALAMGYPDVAVGKAGTVVERPPAQKPEQEKPAEDPHPDPKPPADPVVTCETLVEELLTRLTREELVALIEQRTACDPVLLEHLDELRGETELRELVAAEEEPVLMVPVEAELLSDVRLGEREAVASHRHGECRERRRVEADAHAHAKTGECECTESGVGVEDLVRLVD